MTKNNLFYVSRDEMKWRDKAACLGQETDLFYPDSEKESEVEAAKAICAQCPVRQECLEYAIRWVDSARPEGIWGGMTPNERRKMRRYRENATGQRPTGTRNS